MRNPGGEPLRAAGGFHRPAKRGALLGHHTADTASWQGQSLSWRLASQVGQGIGD